MESIVIYNTVIPVEDASKKHTLASRLTFLIEHGRVTFAVRNGKQTVGVFCQNISVDSVGPCTAEFILEAAEERMDEDYIIDCDNFSKEYTVLPAPRTVTVAGHPFLIKDRTDKEALQKAIDGANLYVNEKKYGKFLPLEVTVGIVDTSPTYRIGFPLRSTSVSPLQTEYCIEDAIATICGLPLDGTAYKMSDDDPRIPKRSEKRSEKKREAKRVRT